MNKLIHSKAALYVLFGILTTILNIGCYFLLSEILSYNYIFSTSTSWIVSVLFAFYTNKIYVFKSKETKVSVVLKELYLFYFFRFFSFFVETISLIFLIESYQFNHLLAKLAVTIFIVICNFFFSKLIIFKSRNTGIGGVSD
ncbi:GtrA family protein [Bacillus sp. AGMB 02131]|uniref:GtrA family protein n=1 Tax=Peribacillus faecalis TaxID=2772559 RepID=A0A927CUZ6_9BACI|nr:GtrA family protein [Peribacillus faecalis]MBD3107674.1 GtrA family protein [Peribacillus faecalis]